MILRDSHGVAQVRFVTGNKILRILKSKGLAPDLPEDLYHLIKKAVAVRKHLERNRKVKEQSHSGFQNLIVFNWLYETTRCFSPVGQRRQVPSDPDREQDPQAGPLLQDQEGPGTQLEVVCRL